MLIDLSSDADFRAEHEANHAAVVFALGYHIKYLTIVKLSAAQKKSFGVKGAVGACDTDIPDSDKIAQIKVLLAGVYFNMGDEDDREVVSQLLLELYPGDEEKRRTTLSQLGDEVLDLLDKPEIKRGIEALKGALQDEGFFDGKSAEQIFTAAQK
jgi:hypothetical protein